MVVVQNNPYLGTAECDNFRVKVFSFRGYFSGAFAERIYGHMPIYIYIYTHTYIHTYIHTSIQPASILNLLLDIVPHESRRFMRCCCLEAAVGYYLQITLEHSRSL